MLAILSISCNDENSLLYPAPEATGELTDADGNKYEWVRYNGLDWMTSNFKQGTPWYELTKLNSRGQEEFVVECDDREMAAANYVIYGNLYTWQAAMNNAPEGWRLPTDEDWKKLEQSLGMSEKMVNEIGWRGDGQGVAIQQEVSGHGIHLLLSGYIAKDAGNYNELRLRKFLEYGYYWSSTLNDDETAVYYRCVFSNHSQIERNLITPEEPHDLRGTTDRYLAVRYVRDAVK